MKPTLTLLTALLLAPLAVAAAEIDLRPQWDEAIPLANPDKGWYHHFYDNHVSKYLPRATPNSSSSPAWTTSTCGWRGPTWSRRRAVSIGALWTSRSGNGPRGLGVAFRITCKETEH